MRSQWIVGVHTFTGGIPRRGTPCVCQKPTPAVRPMASSVVNWSTISSIFAFAKSEGAMTVMNSRKLLGYVCEGETRCPSRSWNKREGMWVSTWIMRGLSRYECGETVSRRFVPNPHVMEISRRFPAREHILSFGRFWSTPSWGLRCSHIIGSRKKRYISSDEHAKGRPRAIRPVDLK